MPSAQPPFTREFVRALYDRPLFSLLDEAREIHRTHHVDQEYGGHLHPP
jgi:hypothetical protein